MRQYTEVIFCCGDLTFTISYHANLACRARSITVLQSPLIHHYIIGISVHFYNFCPTLSLLLMFHISSFALLFPQHLLALVVIVFHYIAVSNCLACLTIMQVFNSGVLYILLMNWLLCMELFLNSSTWLLYLLHYYHSFLNHNRRWVYFPHMYMFLHNIQQNSFCR